MTTPEPRCTWSCDAGEIRDELTSGLFVCNLRRESVAHRHSPECPKDHEDWYACHGFVEPRSVSQPGEVEALLDGIDRTEQDVAWSFEPLTGDGWAILSPDEREPTAEDDGTWNAAGAYGVAVARTREDAVRIVNALNAAALATPPATEELRDIRPCLDCGAPVQMTDIAGHHLDDRLDDTHTPHVALWNQLQPTPPAPEPSTALVGVCIEPRAGGGICGHTEKWYGHGEPMPPAYMGSHLFRPLAAARAEGLDVEALAEAIHAAGFHYRKAEARQSADRLATAYQTALARQVSKG